MIYYNIYKIIFLETKFVIKILKIVLHSFHYIFESLKKKINMYYINIASNIIN